MTDSTTTTTTTTTSPPTSFERKTSKSGEQGIQCGGVLLPSSMVPFHIRSLISSNSSLDNNSSHLVKRKWHSFDVDQKRWCDDFFDFNMEYEPRVRKEWTEAEDRCFLQGLKKYGTRFDLIAAELPRRTKDQVHLLLFNSKLLLL
jgi:hypothetical protein